MLKEVRLKAITIKSPFINEKSDDELFGHLTQQYVTQELLALASLVDKPEPFEGLPVIVSYIKPSLKRGRHVEHIGLEQA
jgi:3',5'-cyclic-nucleotide phosphodiesterase